MPNLQLPLTGYRGLGSVNPYELADITAQDLDLDNCGGPVVWRTDAYVEFAKSYLWTFSWTTSAAAQLFMDSKTSVDSRGDFLLDRVTSTGAEGVRVRFFWPNGRFSSNVRVPLDRYLDNGDDMLVTGVEPVIIRAAEPIGVELEIDASTANGSVAIGFEGRMRYYLLPRN